MQEVPTVYKLNRLHVSHPLISVKEGGITLEKNTFKWFKTYVQTKSSGHYGERHRKSKRAADAAAFKPIKFFVNADDSAKLGQYMCALICYPSVSLLTAAYP